MYLQEWNYWIQEHIHTQLDISSHQTNITTLNSCDSNIVEFYSSQTCIQNKLARTHGKCDALKKRDANARTYCTI